ncbi:MAG: RNA-binding domain-containing protein [Anaerolineae bacterium]|jgi:hypothetical protein|nr:PHP domain-containing protein [Chloroflexota bacterium]
MAWYAMDLHVHTPASKDYQDEGVSYLDILTKAESEGLSILAFTDHNSVAGYAQMMREIEDLTRWEAADRLRPDEKARLDEYRRLMAKMLVLPGFELTATFGFHVIALFEPGTPVRSLEHALLDLNVPVDLLERGETEVGSTVDVITAYEVMAEAGALVMAPHANSTHGVAMFGISFGGQTRIAYTQDPNLHALEVTDLEGGKRRRTTASFFDGSKPQYPRRMHCIQGSDAHRITGEGKNLGVGERATEVFLPELSFSALKQVFLGDDFALTRPYRREAPAFDHVEAARAQGPTLVQSFHENMTRAGGNLHAIVRDVVAFANSNGGTIYVGLSANQRVKPRGVENPAQAIKSVREEIGRQVTPPLDTTLDTLQSGGVDILRIVVPRGADQPYAMEGSRFYIRKEAETSLAVRDEILALVQRALAEQGQLVLSQPVAGAQAPVSTPGAAKALVEQPVAGAEAQPAETSRNRGGRGNGGRRGRSRPAGSEVTPVVEPDQPEEASEVAAVPDEAPEPTTSAQNVAAADAELSVEPPRTGVEIFDTVTRQGTQYHTMRDLRDGALVHNVTRTSARRLWRYAIALHEKGTFGEDKVEWKNGLGLWHSYLRSGKPHYDLVQRDKAGALHIYYGVSEDGIHGAWRSLVGERE